MARDDYTNGANNIDDQMMQDMEDRDQADSQREPGEEQGDQQINNP